MTTFNIGDTVQNGKQFGIVTAIETRKSRTTAMAPLTEKEFLTVRTVKADGTPSKLNKKGYSAPADGFKLIMAAK